MAEISESKLVPIEYPDLEAPKFLPIAETHSIGHAVEAVEIVAQEPEPTTDVLILHELTLQTSLLRELIAHITEL